MKRRKSKSNPDIPKVGVRSDVDIPSGMVFGQRDFRSKPDPRMSEPSKFAVYVQLTADVVRDVVAGRIPRDAGVALLVNVVGFAPAEAERIIGTAGRGPIPELLSEIKALRADVAALREVM